MDRDSILVAVIGDSIAWGQGLKEEHKYHTLVCRRLAELTGRTVEKDVQAHSGARVLEPDGADYGGEVPEAAPAIDFQRRNVRFDPTKVDLVLVTGGADDVGTSSFISPAHDDVKIRGLVSGTAAPHLKSLVTNLVAQFPRALIIHTGYFPMISNDTPIEKIATFVYGYLWPANIIVTPLGEVSLAVAQLLAAMSSANFARNCGAFDDQVKISYHQVMDEVNAGAAAAKDGRGFAPSLWVDVAFGYANAYGTPSTWLWEIQDDVTSLLKPVELWRTNDESFDERGHECDAYLDRITEHSSWWTCRLAAIGHPNVLGAQRYADRIVECIQSFCPDWLKTLMPAPPPPLRQMTADIRPAPIIPLLQEDDPIPAPSGPFTITASDSVSNVSPPGGVARISSPEPGSHASLQVPIGQPFMYAFYCRTEVVPVDPSDGPPHAHPHRVLLRPVITVGAPGYQPAPVPLQLPRPVPSH